MNEQVETLSNGNTFNPEQVEPQEEVKAPEAKPEAEANQKPEAEDKQEEKKPKPNWAERRFAKLTEQKYQYKAEAEHYKKLLEQAGKGQQPQANPDAEPDYDSFNDPKEFHREYAKWAANQALKQSSHEIAEKQKQTQEEKVFEDYETRAVSFKQAHGDFDDVVGELQETLYEARKGFSKEAIQFLGESEKGPEILYHLGQNMDEAMRLASLSPARLVAELGKLEDKVSTGTKQRKAVTTAPPPIAPVGGRARATEDLDSAETMDDFARRWKTQNE